MVEVKKNYLDEKAFSAIESTMLDPNFPWGLMDGNLSIGLTPEQTNFKLVSFTHLFYHQQSNKSSPFFNVLVPLFNKLKKDTGSPKALMRVKGNLMINTGQGIVEHGMHPDYEYDHKGAILSINTCNGHTRIGDKKYMSNRNELLLFNPGENHTGSTTTDSKFRCNIILNYF